MLAPLPHELSDHIIDFLHDDHQALSTCGLVCRAWLSAARYHRFSVTRVYGRLAPFIELLEFSPGITPFIRTLQLQGFSYPHVRRYEPVELLSVLDRLPALRHLGLTSAELDAPLVAALAENTSFKRISGLEIRWCAAQNASDVVRLFMTPALEHLEIDLPACSLEDSDSSIDLPTLKSLCIAQSAQGTDYFSRRIVMGTHRIRKLQALITWRMDAPLVAEMLEALGESLEHLDINVDAETSLQAVFGDLEFSLGNLPNLRVCHLEFGLREMLVADNMSLPWINLLITQVSSPRLEEMSLRIKADNMEDLRALDSECGMRDVSVVDFDDLTILNWEQIGDVLDNARALRRFIVEGQGDATRFLEAIQKRCPSLNNIMQPHKVQ